MGYHLKTWAPWGGKPPEASSGEAVVSVGVDQATLYKLAGRWVCSGHGERSGRDAFPRKRVVRKKLALQDCGGRKEGGRDTKTVS